MSAWQILRSTVLTTGLVLTACGESGSGSSSASTPADITVPATDAPTTEAATTVAATAPPTTLPPTIDLSTLPGLLAVQATSCAPEPYVPTDTGEPFSICTLNPDGTDAKVVSQPGEQPSGLALTRDGTHLWYGDPYNSKFGYVIDLNTGEHRERDRYEPLRSGISPDGQLLLFVDPYTYVWSIASSDGSPLPDGSTSRPVSADTHVYFYSAASWAPDSARFAYLSTDDGNGGDLDCAEVWIGTIDAAPPTKITDFNSNPDGAEGCPDSIRWSPTGDRILMHLLGKPMFVVENLYAIDADGTDLTALTTGVPNTDPNLGSFGAVGTSYAGDWSPDGKYIVFILGTGTPDAPDHVLAVMNADGSQVTPITATPLGITTSLAAIRWALG